MRQRWNRQGPADVTQIAGTKHLFGDFPSERLSPIFRSPPSSSYIARLWRLVQPQPQSSPQPFCCFAITSIREHVLETVGWVCLQLWPTPFSPLTARINPPPEQSNLVMALAIKWKQDDPALKLQQALPSSTVQWMALQYALAATKRMRVVGDLISWL
jgi:hypothetical protein